MTSLRYEETRNPFVFPIILTVLTLAVAAVFYLGHIDKPVPPTQLQYGETK